MAKVNGYDCPVCVTDCDSFVLPSFLSNYCPAAGVYEKSEIKRLLIALEDPLVPGKPVGGPVSWSVAANWATAIDNTAANKVRELFGVGDMSEPNDVTLTVHDNQTVIIERNQVINFDVMDMNVTNYTALRALQCGGAGRVWFETRGGYLYGGNDGIGVNILAPKMVFGRGTDAVLTGKMTLEFRALCSPERIVSPFA